MIKKLLPGYLLMIALFLLSCNKKPEASNSRETMKTTLMITGATVGVILFIAYRTKKK